MHDTTKTTRTGMNPIIIMMLIVIITMVLTFVLPSGEYQRKDKLVIPNSYQVIDKPISVANFISASLTEKGKGQAAPVGIADTLQSVPEGIAKQSGLIFMVLFIGGMFGILNKTGAIEAGLERTLVLTRGNIYLLIPVIMVIFSAGSTFMGLAKEYLLVIPMVIALTGRLGYSNILGLAIVTIAVKVGYLASITNPYALSVAQPLLGLPVFSGLSLRIVTYFVMIALGIVFVLWKAKQERLQNHFQLSNKILFDSKPLSKRHAAMLTVLIIGVVFMVYAIQSMALENQCIVCILFIFKYGFCCNSRHETN